ncbi:hypothetical protein [Actinomadura litoris]|uniref:Uncharacterized protein n=1 Tax=Actinomadura litoris TaxID=2678616 RepID=A0A7K1LAL6_9ACTN|nr:hypothetical protein [Actinomadura litoris]MUN41470.1 hypothetical protein [Actinomadura litoris]
MNRPDPWVAEAVERSAREVAEATQPPPVDLPEDPVAYLAWLRDRPEPTRPIGPVRPSGPRRRAKWLNPDQFRTRRTRGRLAPAETSPAYDAAVTRLQRLPDCGAASIEAARAQLGPTAPYTDLVLHAAAHPVAPPRADNHGHRRTRADNDGHPADAPTCGTCGTALDPDGTCWTCTTTTTQEAS